MYSFSGTVIHGEGRGRGLGFPTANLDNRSLPLSYGVYLVEVELDKKTYQGLLHFGPKKTFNQIVSAEIFIKDFERQIYGKKLEVKVIKKIRGILKFKSVEDLIKQMKDDLTHFV